MKITMKMYEEYLNQLGVPENEQYKNGGRCRGKKYGNWLRRNDKATFDAGYREYVEKLENEKSEEIQSPPINKPSAPTLIDVSEPLIVKEIVGILKKENIEDECHVLTPKEFKDKKYEGSAPLIMICSELESTFIAAFIEESMPKYKYILKPCSNTMLGVYPNKKSATNQQYEIETKLMVV